MCYYCLKEVYKELEKEKKKEQIAKKMFNKKMAYDE